MKLLAIPYALTAAAGTNTTQVATTAFVTSALANSILEYSANISTTWLGTAAPFTQVVTVNGLLVTDKPIIDMVPSGDYATDTLMEKAWGTVYRGMVELNKVTFYSHKKPTVAIPIQIKVVR